MFPLESIAAIMTWEKPRQHFWFVVVGLEAKTTLYFLDDFLNFL